MFARVVNIAHHFAMVLFHNVHAQHLREAQNRIERRAQFMAHAREEFAFGGVGLFGLFLGRGERGFVAFALGDIAQVSGKLGFAMGRDARHGHFDRELRTIGTHCRNLDTLIEHQGFACRQVARQSVQVRFPQSRRDNDFRYLQAHDVVATMPESSFRCRIPLDDPAIVVDRNNAVDRRFKNGRFTRFAFL